MTPVGEPRAWRAAGVLALVLAIVLGTCIRIRTATGDANFDTEHSAGLLKSDPGLLFYLTERVVDAGGGVPADFRADPRIEHPALTDIPATYTVGQEFLVAWAAPFFGAGVPLHMVALWLMAACAALAVVGVYGLSFELTRSSAWASFAALLYLILPANYRTIGFILVREDLSLPLFAIHLWLLARAVRVGTVPAFALAGAALGAALATWHAMTFFVAIEAAVFFFWFLRTGENPFTERAPRALLAVTALFTLAVPALFAKQALLSLPMQLAFALLAAAILGRTRPRGARTAIAFAAWAALFGVSYALSRALDAGAGDFSHVFRLLLAKVRHLGVLPADPTAIPFESRLLWQGPFATLALDHAVASMRLGLLLALPAFARAARTWGLGKGPRGEAWIAALAAFGLGAAWLVQRVFVLPGLVLPVVAAVFIGRRSGAATERRAQGRTLVLGSALAALVLWQVIGFGTWLRDLRISWYEPAVRQAELATLVRELPRFVPEGAAVAGDFMTSTAILAQTGRPIVLQPKWETRASRRRVEQFLTTFFHESPAVLRRMLLEEYDCRYLLVDRGAMLMSRYVAGLRAGEPLRPGTAAERFLSQDAGVLADIPGFELLWRSPPELLQTNGRPSDFYRLYAVLD